MSRTFNHTILRIKNADGTFDGLPALRGLDSYELAVQFGFEGTEEEWMESIIGSGWIGSFQELETKHNALSDRVNAATADGAVTSAKIADGAVTRAKLATDALYSPIVDGVSTRTITAADIGKTIKGSWNAATTVTLTQANSTSMPNGVEFAVFNYSQDAGAGTKIVGDGVRFFISGDNVNYTSATIKVADPFGMIALKKISHNTNLGDGWLVTGNVEVVE